MAEGVEIIGPASSFYFSQRLKLHYVDWGNETAPPLVLVHGGRDHCRSWDWVARDLRRDHRVVAPDLRGHGDSDWAIGGMYSISDFVLDLSRLLDALGLERSTIVAHSLGGAVALQYAGVFPERVEKLVVIEGLGPPPEMIERMTGIPAWERMKRWIETMGRLAGRQTRRYASLEEAAGRMQEVNSFLSDEQAHHLTLYGAYRNEDGTFSWKFDNYVRAISPHRFDPEETRELWGRITCPVLLVRGTESWASDPEEDGRIEAFQSARRVNVEKAAHWVHHDQLGTFLREVRAFLAE